MEALKVMREPGRRKTASLKRALLIEGAPGHSEPIYGLARELRDLGVNVQIVDHALINSHTLKWLYFARRSGAVIFVRYESDDGYFFQRQLFRARLLGCILVRWWVGSDVLNARESVGTMCVARAIDKAVHLNITVSPHLVTELREIGISAEYIASFCDIRARESHPPSNLPKGVLSYLPTQRRDFYGESIIISAIEENPDLEFYIIADESHALAKYQNVSSLGWVEEMDDVWGKVGMLLRVTTHDGMPRMVLEALARHRYVIYSEIFEGCWFARSKEDVQQYLQTFKTLERPNIIQSGIIESSMNAASDYASKVTRHLEAPLSAKRLWGELTAYRNL